MKRLQFSSYQASTTFSISIQTSLSHSQSLSPCHFILYDVLAMARQTVADKIGQLRHLRERGFGLARKHVRILPSTALNFSPFASVFVWGNRIGQVADKWQGGEGKRDIDSHFTMSHEADKSHPSPVSVGLCAKGVIYVLSASSVLSSTPTSVKCCLGIHLIGSRAFALYSQFVYI